MYEAVLTGILSVAVARCAWLLVGLVRMVRVHRRARYRKWTFPELLTVFELPLFFGLTFHFWSRPASSMDPSTTAWLTAAVGLLLGLAGLLVSLWSLYTAYRAGLIIDIGHYIKEEHTLVTWGPYGWVRHPTYLGVFLIWLGLAIGFRSPVVLALTALYVIPAYLVYIRSEEEMMLSEFGEEYQDYCRRVGMIVPRRSTPA
jgi:protein-S-isoprenylcysteine O-methyltransferase Ste14